MVDGGSLENYRAREGPLGSNPSPSAQNRFARKRNVCRLSGGESPVKAGWKHKPSQPVFIENMG